MKIFESEPRLNNQKTTPTTFPDASWMESLILERFRQTLALAPQSIQLTLPSGHRCQIGKGQYQAHLKIHHLRAFWRLYTGGLNGWSQAYVKGEWDCDDVPGLIQWALACETQIEHLASSGRVSAWFDRLYHLRRDNTLKGSKENIEAHYDLGNDFYRLWLDNTMTYSSAIFASPKQSLEQAQLNKYRTILSLLDLPEQPQKLLEIGCGWGGFADVVASETSHQLQGVTLSPSQLKWAKRRISQRDNASNIHLSLTDYRDLEQQVDAVVSIEMLEAVGEQHWDTYFSQLHKVLKPGGKAAIQVITIENDRFEEYRKKADFIQRYIFPGGMLPSPQKLQEKFSEHGFTLERESYYGKDYAQTLRYWRQAFEAQWDNIASQGFDERFKRLWHYYLTYCEGGFEHGSIDLGLYIIRKTPV